jgi:integrase
VKRTKAIDSLLTKEEFLAMLQAGKDAKDKAILCLALVGLRASELSRVQRHWCDMSNRTIKIPPVFAKRRKGRIVPFGNLRIVCEVLTAFFALEPKGVALTRIAIWQRIKRLASAAGVTHPVTPHGLRATGATWLAMARYSITGLMDHFGWSELRTAQHCAPAAPAPCGTCKRRAQMSSEFVVYLISLRPAYRARIDRQICSGLLLYQGQSL